MKIKTNLVTLLAIGCISVTPAFADIESRQVNIYNWNDYIGSTTLSDFQKQTGIKTVYDIFDTNETLESKLLVGNTGYDIVVPSNNFLSRQITAGIYTPLDRSRLPNYVNLDKSILKRLEDNDPNNTYSIPYMWGTTGILYNKDKIQKVLGVDHIDSWSALFDPDTVQKLSACGVSLKDTPDDVYASVLHFMGRDPNSSNIKDYEEALALLQKIRPHVTYFNSSPRCQDSCRLSGFSQKNHPGGGKRP